LQVEACGICGTDLLKIDRQLPKVPVVLGHELCGVVTQTGKGVSNFKPGDRMVVAHHVPCQSCHYCLHGNPSMCLHFKSTNLDPGGFSEYLRVPAQHVQHTAFKVPQKLKSEFALMTEPLSCCIRNIRRANLKKNDVVVIIGMGSIGLMSLQLLKLQECQVITLDLKEERRDLSLKLGADFSFTQADDAFTKSLEKISQGRGADLIIFTAGNHQLFSQSFQWIRNGG
ncbi:MAG: alcohol dehydrogenase catalytic domain-containing protein, partial [Deltaproteobacteria bacterium]|nr:alcohol dehydrogenase catalytic domain-containing protein [Deltaproteobacteria bacterium]